MSKQPRTVVALITDLFFSVKVRNELKAAGFETKLVRNVEALHKSILDIDPALALIDMGAGVDWNHVSVVTQDDQTSNTPVLVFGPHKNISGRREAKSAGVVRVLSNSQFHGDLAGYVERYARSEEPSS